MLPPPVWCMLVSVKRLLEVLLLFVHLVRPLSVPTAFLLVAFRLPGSTRKCSNGISACCDDLSASLYRCTTRCPNRAGWCPWDPVRTGGATTTTHTRWEKRHTLDIFLFIVLLCLVNGSNIISGLRFYFRFFSCGIFGQYCSRIACLWLVHDLTCGLKLGQPRLNYVGFEDSHIQNFAEYCDA